MRSARRAGGGGSVSTGRASGAQGVRGRLQARVLQGAELPLPAIRSMIESALDIIVHLGRTRDHKRRVLEISEVIGIEHDEINLKPLYKFDGQKLEKLADLTSRQKLLDRL